MVPSVLHFRMPAEWERHACTFIAWPVRRSMCFPENYRQVATGYSQFASAIAEFEPVTILANPEEAGTLEKIYQGKNVRVLSMAHDDSWFRDNGPTFLVAADGQVGGINWRFNAWGEKYTPYDRDDRLAGMLLDSFNLPRFNAPLVLEGGSIHVDGEGTLLTTEQCLLNPNRNPKESRETISALLKDYLAIRQIIWLKKGLSGDETDGHVDNLACFAAPGKVLIQVCEDPSDENYTVTQENLAILEQTVDAAGRKLEVIPVQQPPARYYRGKRLTLSYMNFYLVNDGLILPVFGGEAAETDQAACDILSRTFPNRRIRTIDGTAIISEGGNVHCATQQMPAGKGGNKR